MAKRLLEKDPFTGITTWYEGNGDGSFKIAQTQDVEKILDHNKRLANETSYKRQGIKEDWYHFATVPITVVHEIMQKYHVDFGRQEDLPKIEKILQRDYKRTLTVDKI